MKNVQPIILYEILTSQNLYERKTGKKVTNTNTKNFFTFFKIHPYKNN